MGTPAPDIDLTATGSRPIKWRSDPLVSERAQPWLGTVVNIRVEELPAAEAHAAIDAAFAEIAMVHRLMSFHSAESDVSRLNREACLRPVEVHSSTLEVLHQAAEISAATEGCFDISVGAELVDRGLLPEPSETNPAFDGRWQDIQVRSDGRIAFLRPLWIDLGGIAKGYAVDRAMSILVARGVHAALVNAGGDIRVIGDRPEVIRLDLETPTGEVALIELENGSIASSMGNGRRRWRANRFVGPHVDGTRCLDVPTDRFVSVLAERCVIADALTKVVMARGQASSAWLQRLGAAAHFHDPQGGWQSLNRAAEAQ
jgi:thiamine biosynthesis lipoprotein